MIQSIVQTNNSVATRPLRYAMVNQHYTNVKGAHTHVLTLAVVQLIFGRGTARRTATACLRAEKESNFRLVCDASAFDVRAPLRLCAVENARYVHLKYAVL